MAIITVVLGLATLSFRSLTDSSAVTNAVQTLTTYASIARAYAIENSVETMMVVNPVNGRLELWHANPPRLAGPWDIQSGGLWSLNSPPEPNPLNAKQGCNGYAFVPIWDESVALPRGADGKPTVIVHPVDFDATYDGSGRLRSTVDDALWRNRDNLNWVCLCFDTRGRLLQRMRRIATRPGSVANPLQDVTGLPARGSSNRRPDGTPDTARVQPGVPLANDNYAVDNHDTLLTSTVGFIVSDRRAFENFQQTVKNETIDPSNPTPQHIFDWLKTTRVGGDPIDGSYEKFARHIVLGRESGRPLAVTEK